MRNNMSPSCNSVSNNLKNIQKRQKTLFREKQIIILVIKKEKKKKKIGLFILDHSPPT